MMPLNAFIRQQTCRASWQGDSGNVCSSAAGEIGFRRTRPQGFRRRLDTQHTSSQLKWDPRSPIVILVATNDSTASENGMEPAQACAENSEDRHPLKSVAVLNGTNEERVAAILEDAEEIYLEAARIVEHRASELKSRRPRFRNWKDNGEVVKVSRNTAFRQSILT